MRYSKCFSIWFFLKILLRIVRAQISKLVIFVNLFRNFGAPSNGLINVIARSDYKRRDDSKEHAKFLIRSDFLPEKVRIKGRLVDNLRAN